MSRTAKVFTFFALLVFLLMGSFVILFTTNAGLQLSINLTNHFLAGKLSIDKIDGSLKSPLFFEGVKYEDDQTLLTIDRLTLDWQPTLLIQKNLRIDQLHINHVRLHNKISAPEQPSKPLVNLPNITLPIDLEIAKLNATDLIISNTVINTITLTGSFKKNLLTINNFAATLPGLKLGINGKLQPNGNYPGDLNAQWHWQVPGQPTIAGKGNIVGNLERTDIKAKLSAPAAVELIATIRDPLQQESWQAMLTLPTTDLASIDSRLPVHATTMSIKGKGTWNYLESQAHIETEYAEQSILADTSIRYENAKWSITQLTLNMPSTGTSLRTTGSITTKPLLLALNGNWNNLGWPLQDLSLAKSTSGKFSFRGNPEKYQIFANGKLSLKTIPQLDWSIEGQGTTEKINIRSLQAQIPNNGVITTSASVIFKPTLAFNVIGNWHEFQWPLQASATTTITSKRGTFQASGDTKKYSFEVNGDISGPRLPSTKLSVHGFGDTKHVVLSSVIANTLEGDLRGVGIMQWQPELTWKANIAAHSLNPAIIASEWPGKISANFSSEGKFSNGKMAANTTISQLMGELRGLPLSGSAALAIAGDKYVISPLVVNLGDAHLSAAGEISDQWKLSWALDVANLHAFAPGASGILEAQGNLIGPRTSPRIVAKLLGRQLAYSTYEIGNLTVDSDVDLFDKQDSKAIVHAVDIKAGTVIEDISLQASGRISNHTIKFTSDLPKASTAILAHGGYYSGGAWSGTIDKSKISLANTNNWELASPVALYVSKEAAHTDQWCWNQIQNPGSLCGYVSWFKQNGIKSDITLDQFSLALLKPLLPLDTNLQGSINGHASVETTINGESIATVELTSSKGEITYQAGTVREVTASYSDAIIATHLENGIVNTAFATSLSDQGEIGGFLSTSLAASDTGDRDIDGHFFLKFPSLSMLPAFFSGIDGASGSLSSDLKISGTTKTPIVDGFAEISQGQAVLLKPGLTLENIRFKLTADKSNFGIEGDVKSGEGNLRMQGNASMKNDNLNLNLSIIGDSFTAMDTSEYKVFISPDVTVNIANHAIDVNGTILIPQADITPHDFKGTVKSSEDVIFVEQTQEQQLNSWNFNSLLRFELGDRVKFKGFGLQGQLLGTLVIIENPQQLTSALGEIRIEGGQYKAYGQDLVIERGRILFVGGPIADPGVDVRAVRKTEQVTAGVNVRGPLRTPTLTVFSIPQVSEQDALAYLLLGRPLGEASTDEGQRLYRAATSLGVAGGGYLAKQIGKQFGIEDVSIETGGEYKEPTLVIGKYLSPRLYVGYGLGLVEQMNSLRLRYRLSSKWTLEADSGRTSGADLLYTLEVN